MLRAKIVLAGQQRRQRNQQIARELGCKNRTVRFWRGWWLEVQNRLAATEAEDDAAKLENLVHEVLADQPRSAPPAIFSAEQICQIIALACEKREESGQPISEWTPRELPMKQSNGALCQVSRPSKLGVF